jgi:hypothetical protein
MAVAFRGRPVAPLRRHHPSWLAVCLQRHTKRRLVHAICGYFLTLSVASSSLQRADGLAMP